MQSFWWTHFGDQRGQKIAQKFTCMYVACFIRFQNEPKNLLSIYQSIHSDVIVKDLTLGPLVERASFNKTLLDNKMHPFPLQSPLPKMEISARQHVLLGPHISMQLLYFNLWMKFNRLLQHQIQGILFNLRSLVCWNERHQIGIKHCSNPVLAYHSLSEWVKWRNHMKMHF